MHTIYLISVTINQLLYSNLTHHQNLEKCNHLVLSFLPMCVLLVVAVMRTSKFAYTLSVHIISKSMM